MIREATAVSFRQNLGDMLNQVQYRHDSIVIKRDGKPVAALVDARLFERIRRLQARFDGLCERIEAGYAEVPEAEGLAEIDAAVAASPPGADHGRPGRGARHQRAAFRPRLPRQRARPVDRRVAPHLAPVGPPAWAHAGGDR